MIHPPPNPHADAARTAMQQHNATIPTRQRKLYPLDDPRPLWVHDCNDCGVTIYVDDPASLDVPC